MMRLCVVMCCFLVSSLFYRLFFIFIIVEQGFYFYYFLLLFWLIGWLCFGLIFRQCLVVQEDFIAYPQFYPSENGKCVACQKFIGQHTRRDVVSPPGSFSSLIVLLLFVLLLLCLCDVLLL